ncbi:MAG TPA: S41 family peptidase [Thermomicrobiales bacterium]|nr:S41 family peptidase [Thermomicrobiales bacterium]
MYPSHDLSSSGHAGQWETATATRPVPQTMSRTAQRIIVGLVVVSFVFLAFAGGMVFQRFVVADDAEASTGGAPETFDTAWDLVLSRYVDPTAIDEDAMLEAAIDGMLQTLQDEGHTRFMTAEESQSDRENLQGEYVGVGIQVNQRDDDIVVVAPIDHSPAQEAGIMAGDVLISIDGVNVVGQSVDEVVNQVRGEEGSQVTLAFTREGEPSPISFTVTRRKIDVSSVAWTMLDDDIALIRLTQFSSGAGDDLAQALGEAKADGAQSVVLDLRNNPGGYISEAIQIGSTFVPEGETIFITQVRDGSQEKHPATAQSQHIGDLPLVVLINEGSASSSEIVSGAIKANNPNATVIGETTFGTGTVLSNFGLDDGSSLLLGTELWLTPEGKLIKNQGIRPDVVVGLPDGQFPFTPVDNADNDVTEINDYQLEWATHVLQSGQAGDPHPTKGMPPTRAQ